MDPAAVDLEQIITLAEFEAIARQRMDRVAFDYVAGGAWDEVSLAENEAAWRRYRLRPRVLIDVSTIDTSTTVLGAPAAMPLAIAPMAAQGLAHPDGEVAAVRAAAAAGVPYTASTMSTCSLEQIAAAAPDAVRWFQLYTQADPALSRTLVERAESAGYRAITVTVDLPLLGYRERDLRSGFNLSVPLGNFVERGPTHADHARVGEDGYEVLEARRRTPLTWDHLAEIRSWSNLPLVLKGITSPDDARLAAEHGVDGIIVSNHGARQLDRVAAPIDVLERVLEAADGRLEVWVDGGVRRGLDILIAIALGARGVLVGRPMFWALAAGGEAGVARALAILQKEFELGLTLVGAPAVADVRREHVA